MPPVWDAVVCKPKGLPEVAAIAAVGAGSCLSILPCSHRATRDVNEEVRMTQGTCATKKWMKETRRLSRSNTVLGSEPVCWRGCPVLYLASPSEVLVC